MSEASQIEIVRRGPEKPWLGQLVPIDVNVWRPTGTAPLEPFTLDDVVAAGMIVKWSEQAPPPDERQLGDVHFLVQHRTLLVFPQSDGELTLPPIVARWTDPTTKAELAVMSQPTKFEAAAPPASGGVLPLVASFVRVEQQFDCDVEKLRVGDGFTRTLTLRATDTDAVVFPELTPAAPSGMTTYPGRAKAASSAERGQFLADSTLKLTYVVDRVGPHRLTGVSVRWLEPRSGRYFDASVPDLTLWTRPNPSLGFQCFGTARAATVATELGSFLVVALLATAVARRRRHGPGHFERVVKDRRRERRSFSEAVRAARSGNDLRLLQRIYAWLAVRFPRGLDRTLAPLEQASAEARTACTSFETELFASGKTSPSPGSLVPMLRRARQAMGRERQRDALQSLNPAKVSKGGE